MKGVRFMSERLTWDEIAEKYPMQWVGLTDVRWNPENDADIESAVVSYSGLPRADVMHMMYETKGKVIARFTEPNKVLFMGTMF